MLGRGIISLTTEVSFHRSPIENILFFGTKYVVVVAFSDNNYYFLRIRHHWFGNTSSTKKVLETASLSQNTYNVHILFCFNP